MTAHAKIILHFTDVMMYSVQVVILYPKRKTMLNRNILTCTIAMFSLSHQGSEAASLAEEIVPRAADGLTYCLGQEGSGMPFEIVLGPYPTIDWEIGQELLSLIRRAEYNLQEHINAWEVALLELGEDDTLKKIKDAHCQCAEKRARKVVSMGLSSDKQVSPTSEQLDSAREISWDIYHQFEGIEALVRKVIGNAAYKGRWRIYQRGEWKTGHPGWAGLWNRQ
jgi:hypothetical protein